MRCNNVVLRSAPSPAAVNTMGTKISSINRNRSEEVEDSLYRLVSKVDVNVGKLFFRSKLIESSSARAPEYRRLSLCGGR